MQHNEIRITDLSKAFGEKTVFCNLSLTFQNRAITCLMGASGSGKTTLLRILLGLEKADGGKIEGLEKPIICLFQEDRLFEDFSVLKNIRAAAPQASHEEILAHLTELGLADEQKSPVRSLSGGMKRRVALIRAVLAPSATLLLDEPFKGLDMQTAKTAADYLLRHRNGRTVLLVTHESDVAQRLAAPIVTLPFSSQAAED